MVTRTPRPITLATALLAATVLAGCGDVATPDTGTASAPTTTSASTPTKKARPKTTPADDPVTQRSTPSPSPSRSTGRAEEQPTRSTTSRVTLASRLLAADELPGIDRSFHWTEAGTSPREPRSLAGTCHRFAMLSIGAMRVEYRSYLPASGGSGGDVRADQLIARFADPKTAWRAFEVLKSWAADCDAALASYATHDVGPLTEVSVAGRAGHWYLLSYGPARGDADARYYDAQGMALAGNRVTVLRMRLVAQDYDYPTGKEPMVTAVRRATVKLL